MVMKLYMNKLIACALCVFFTTSLVAQDSLSTRLSSDSLSLSMPAMGVAGGLMTKSAADSAYIENDFATAIQIYETILETEEAAEIYYNLGNSYYKSGDVARAILNYERALLLKPGNGDIRANLKIARSKTVDKVDEVPEIFFVSWIKSLINSTSVDVWGRWGIAFFLLMLVGLYFFFFAKKVVLRKTGFICSLAFLFLTACANIFAFYQKGTLVNRNTAIVITPSVTVRSTPNKSGTSLFILHEGHKVTLKDNSMKNWKEISLEDGKIGWVSASDIEVI